MLTASPIVLGLLLVRLVLHGLIAWMLWLVGEKVWGPVAQIYDGLLPASVFSVVALILAWRAVRGLPPAASVTAQGVCLTDALNERLITVAEIYALAPVARNDMVWYLIWPVIPWRLLTQPDSLLDWWSIKTSSGVFFFRCADVAEMKCLVADSHLLTQERRSEQGIRAPQEMLSIPDGFQPFRFNFPWQFEVAVCSIVFLDSSLLILLVLYGVGRIGWIGWQSRSNSLWRRVQVRTEAPMPVLFSDTTGANQREFTAHPSDDRKVCVSIDPPLNMISSTYSMTSPPTRLSQAFWPLTLLPLHAVAILGDWCTLIRGPRAGKRIIPLFRWCAWLLLRGPSELVRLVGHLLRMVRRLANRSLKGGAWLFLRTPPQIARAFGLAISLWQTVLFTLAGWAAAVLLAYPLTVLLADPQAMLWHETWMVRGLLWRSSVDQSARQASLMLDKAQLAGDAAAVRAVLQGGAVDGVFHLDGWQSERRQKAACRDAVPLMPGVRMQLDEKIDAPALLREVACNVKPGHLQSELLADAYRRTGERLDIHVAITSGDPALLPLALENEGVPETRDWQGRTPLLLALDLAATGGERRPGWLSLAQSLQRRGADVSAIDYAGRSAVYLAVQAGLSGEALKPYPLTEMSQSSTALGATLVHAAAASGEVATFHEVVLKRNWRLDLASRTSDGRNALHFARGAAMVHVLYQHGLDPDLRDARGRLPLHAAILSGDSAAARALVRITLAPQTTDSFGRMPLDYAPAAARKIGDRKSLSDAERGWQDLVWEIAERTRK